MSDVAHAETAPAAASPSLDEIKALITAAIARAAAPATSTKRATMRNALAIMSTALIAIAFLLPAIAKACGADITLDADLKGAITLQWGLVMGHYFGTSQSSAAKDKTIENLTGS